MTQITIDGKRRAVAWWLLVCCTLVFAMIVLGGITRLTGSGLSMVDWRPVTGFLPPMNDAEWAQVFALYQQSPEFVHVNAHMDVESFKGIFWLEYFHRLLGRMIGLVFILPFLVFLARGYIRARQTPKYLLMFVLGGLQGVLGWYMVKSGLVDNPHVSQYRLTAHLAAALLIYGYMLWVALGLFYERTPPDRPHPWFGRTVALTVLVSITIVSGGFVAGLKAGLAYNTFPLMGGELIPPGLFMLEPAWQNFFANVTLVQFNHRLLAIATLFAVLVYWVFVRRQSLDVHAHLAAHLLFGAVLVQVTLGISTLLLRVPIVLASAHQAVAVIVFTAALFLCHRMHFMHHRAGETNAVSRRATALKELEASMTANETP